MFVIKIGCHNNRETAYLYANQLLNMRFIYTKHINVIADVSCNIKRKHFNYSELVNTIIELNYFQACLNDNN